MISAPIKVRFYGDQLSEVFKFELFEKIIGKEEGGGGALFVPRWYILLKYTDKKNILLKYSKFFRPIFAFWPIYIN